jgi:hypothetical protein
MSGGRRGPLDRTPSPADAGAIHGSRPIERLVPQRTIEKRHTLRHIRLARFLLHQLHCSHKAEEAPHRCVRSSNRQLRGGVRGHGRSRRRRASCRWTSTPQQRRRAVEPGAARRARLRRRLERRRRSRSAPRLPPPLACLTTSLSLDAYPSWSVHLERATCGIATSRTSAGCSDALGEPSGWSQ